VFLTAILYEFVYLAHRVKSQFFCDFLAASLIDSCPKFQDIVECQIHWTLEPLMPDHYAASKLQGTNTQWRRVTSQTNGDLNCTAAEAWQLAILTFALTSDAEIQSEFCKEIILIRVEYSLKLQFTIITQAQFYAPETRLMKVGLNWL